jgi:hypothetical protein
LLPRCGTWRGSPGNVYRLPETFVCPREGDVSLDLLNFNLDECQNARAVAVLTAPHEDRAAAHLCGALNSLQRYNRAARAGRDRCIPHCVRINEGRIDILVARMQPDQDLDSFLHVSTGIEPGNNQPGPESESLPSRRLGEEKNKGNVD